MIYTHSPVPQSNSASASAEDWVCEKCDCSNFARRNECFRCSAKKPEWGASEKNKSRTGSAKDERTQIWPVESWLYNRKLERVEERKLRQLRQDPEKWQYAVMPMFFCMIFWFRCYSLSIGAKSDCVRGEDQLKGSELATCHRIFGKKCSRLRWVGNLAVVKWFCVETWAFWRGTKRISNDIKCAMLYPFPVTEKNM